MVKIQAQCDFFFKSVLYITNPLCLHTHAQQEYAFELPQSSNKISMKAKSMCLATVISLQTKYSLMGMTCHVITQGWIKKAFRTV